MSPDFWLLLALFTKHLIADFFVQNRDPWLWQHKGEYGHLGGVTHSAHHALGTLLVFAVFGPTKLWCLLAAPALDFVVHYHVDYSKMKLNAVYELGPLTSPYFWDLLGIDQYAHALTYFWIVWLVS